MKSAHRFTRPFPLSIALLSLLVLAGCGHTNNLSKYDFRGKTFMREVRVDPDASEVNVSIDLPGDNPVAGVLVSIGEGISSAEASRKLRAAVRPEGVASAISAGFERDFMRYLDVTPGTSSDIKPDYIVHTLLKRVAMTTSASGVYLQVKAEIAVISRETARDAWRNCEEVNLGVREFNGAAAAIPVLSTASSIANLAQFFGLPEKEIQDAVLQSAQEIGFLMGETLRSDVAGMNR